MEDEYNLAVLAVAVAEDTRGTFDKFDFEYVGATVSRATRGLWVGIHHRHGARLQTYSIDLPAHTNLSRFTFKTSAGFDINVHVETFGGYYRVEVYIGTIWFIGDGGKLGESSVEYQRKGPRLR